MQFDGATVCLKPALPKHWQSVELPVTLRGGQYSLRVTRDEIVITAAAGNREALAFAGFGGPAELCGPGAELRLRLAEPAAAEN
ncbi:glycosyl hydrolase family 65 protein [Paenibacillus sonchi]|uniref:glycosyl hydrolase family 65 protein n=1 Tax=Paenibacillus sonchi TaxID=373687 RepID=UPI001F1ADCE9|nr:glycosyl hydrolase family 65 protein [Paenibacillus sonchi]